MVKVKASHTRYRALGPELISVGSFCREIKIRAFCLVKTNTHLILIEDIIKFFFKIRVPFFITF